MGQVGINHISQILSEVHASKYTSRSVSLNDRFVPNALTRFSKRGSTVQGGQLVNSGNEQVVHDQQTVPPAAIAIIIVLVVLFFGLLLSTVSVFFFRQRRYKRRRKEMLEAPFPHRQHDVPPSRSTSNWSQAPLISVQLPSEPPVSYHTYVPITGGDGTKYLVPRPSVRREFIPSTTLPSFAQGSFPVTAPSDRTLQRVSSSSIPNSRFLIAQPGHILKVMNGSPSDIDGRGSFRMSSPQVPTSSNSIRRMTYTDLPRINTGFNGDEFFKPATNSHISHKGSIDSSTSRANSGDSWETNASSSRRPRGGRPLPMPPSIPPPLLPMNPVGRR